MSYEIATSITFVGDKIKVKSHSNNVFPKYDTHWELPNNDDGIRQLLKLIDEGSVQPIPSANDYKWSGIEIELNDLTGEERFEKFKQLATQPTRGWYIVQFNTGSYLAKMPPYYGNGYGAVKLQPYALRMRKAKAEYLAKRYKHLNPVVLEYKDEEPMVVTTPPTYYI